MEKIGAYALIQIALLHGTLRGRINILSLVKLPYKRALRNPNIKGLQLHVRSERLLGPHASFGYFKLRLHVCVQKLFLIDLVSETDSQLSGHSSTLLVVDFVRNLVYSMSNFIACICNLAEILPHFR